MATSLNQSFPLVKNNSSIFILSISSEVFILSVRNSSSILILPRRLSNSFFPMMILDLKSSSIYLLRRFDFSSMFFNRMSCSFTRTRGLPCSSRPCMVFRKKVFRFIDSSSFKGLIFLISLFLPFLSREYCFAFSQILFRRFMTQCDGFFALGKIITSFLPLYRTKRGDFYFFTAFFSTMDTMFRKYFMLASLLLMLISSYLLSCFQNSDFYLIAGLMLRLDYSVLNIFFLSLRLKKEDLSWNQIVWRLRQCRYSLMGFLMRALSFFSDGPCSAWSL